MKRFIILFVLLALIVCLAAPVFAASWMHFLDPNEYFVGTYDNQYYSYNRYDLPHVNTNWWFDGKTTSGEIDWYNTEIDTTRTLLFRYYPFGQTYYFDLTKLPEQPTALTWSVPIDLTLYLEDGDTSTPSFNIVPMVGFTDASDNSLGYYSFGATAYTGQSNYVLEGSVTVPEGAVCCSLIVAVNIPVNGVVRVRTGMTPVQKPVTIRVHQPFAPVAQVIDPFETGKVYINGDTEEVTFSTLHDKLYWSSTPNCFSSSGSNFSFSLPMYQVEKEDVFAFLLGQYGFVSTESFDMASEITSSFDMTLQFENQTTTFDYSCALLAHFFDDDFVELRSGPVLLFSMAGEARDSSVISVPLSGSVPVESFKNASYFRLIMEMEIDGFTSNSTTCTINLESSESTITVPISALGQMSSQGRLTNQKLDEVKEAISNTNKALDDLNVNVQNSFQESNEKLDGIHGAIDDTNDKLDDIIHGQVTPAVPDGSNIVGDLESQEGAIRDQASVQVGQAEDIQASALDVVFMYASAFSAFSLIFDAYGSIPFFSGLLYVSLAVGIFCLVVGLTLDGAGAWEDAEKRDQKHLRRQINKGRKKK